MRLAWIVFVLFVAIEPLAQVVQVIDPLEYKPIPDVVISDAKYTKAVKTNMLGEALIEREGFDCQADLLLKLAGLGARFGEVALPLDYRAKAGSSHMPVRRTVWRTLSLFLRERLRR